MRSSLIESGPRSLPCPSDGRSVLFIRASAPWNELPQGTEMLRLRTRSLTSLREHRRRGSNTGKRASSRDVAPTVQIDPGVANLISELLDAHLDTFALVRETESSPAWDAHLDYLRALQRIGRAALATWTPQPGDN